MFEIGRENVQLKIKTVKSDRNRYLYFSTGEFMRTLKRMQHVHVCLPSCT